MGGDRGWGMGDGGARKIIGFWDVTLCRLVGRHQHFRPSSIEHVLQQSCRKQIPPMPFIENGSHKSS